MRITMGRLIHGRDHTYERPIDLPYWTMGLNLRGSAVIAAEGREILSKSPQINLTAPHARYRTWYGGGKTWESAWAIFTPRRDWDRLLRFPPREGLSEAFGALELRDAALRRKIFAAFDEGIAALRSALPQREALAFNAIERVLLLADTINPLAAHARLDERIRAAMEYLAANLEAGITVADLARQVHLSESHLAHLFREQVGCAPMAYLEQQRIGRAQELLLSTSDPINRIARAVGIDNAFHFSTRFRQHVGRSPRAYRQHPQ